MATLGEFWRRILFSFKRNKMDSELAEEMRQHLELKARQNIATGMSEEEAGYAAKRQLGNLTRMEEESRGHWGFPFLESFLQDIRYGLRGLRKAPGFTLVAAITLALGIGATTVIFSVVNTVLLRPLPYKDSPRIAEIHTITPLFPEFQLGESKPDFDDIKSGTHAFESLALFQNKNANLTAPGTPEQISVATVSAEFIPLFGVSPILGRTFQPGDEEKKDGNVALLSQRLWRERFGSDPNVVGKTITLEQNLYTVIGVMPAGFDNPDKDDDVWMPLNTSTKEASERSNWFFGVMAKVKAGEGMPAAQAELDGVASRLGVQYPKEDQGIKFKLTPLQEQLRGQVKSGLMLLLGAVGFLLLIACANVSNLILSRGVQRQSEIAIRAALGASRPRILRQLLIESMLLSGLGGAAGMLFAIYGVAAYRALAPASVPRMNELHADLTIAWIALALSSVAGILCGLAPALHTSRPDLNLALKERLSSGAPTRFSLRGALVVIEVALALVLLDGSALMVQSMMRTLSVDTGFRTDHVLTAELNLPEFRYATLDSRLLFVHQLLDTLHANEQLKNVALSDSPLNSNLKMMRFDAGSLGADDKSATLQQRIVAPGFFEMLRIQLISGRLFKETDTKGAPQVAIINQAMVRRYFPGQNSLGKILKFGPESGDQCQIIGVVADTRDVDLKEEARPQIYFSLLQTSDSAIHLFIRTSADPLTMAPDLRKAVWSIDKDQPISHVQSMTEVISQSVSEPRFRTWLLGVFAAAGLTLTLVGIYGVVSYMAAQRTREIGIRVALGAQRSNVLQLVLGQGVRLTVIGAIVGVLGSLALARWLKSELFGIKPTDPVTLISAAVLMLFVALAACYLPARRATRIDPLEALRHE
jgi:predicted permease